MKHPRNQTQVGMSRSQENRIAMKLLGMASRNPFDKVDSQREEFRRQNETDREPSPRVPAAATK